MKVFLCKKGCVTGSVCQKRLCVKRLCVKGSVCQKGCAQKIAKTSATSYFSLLVFAHGASNDPRRFAIFVHPA